MGVIVNVRVIPVPATNKLLTGTSPVFVESTVTISASGAVSVSLIVNVMEPIGMSSSVAWFGTSDIVGGVLPAAQAFLDMAMSPIMLRKMNAGMTTANKTEFSRWFAEYILNNAPKQQCG
jgi:hypothetical protein